MSQRRIKLTIAYDGTGYCGWQIQPNGITVQEVLNDALLHVLKEPVRTIGASRTDAGVHALGNVVIFDTTSLIPADKFAFALNTWLPDDVKVQSSEEAAPDFHPHFVDSVKTYEYKILNRQMPDPTRRLDSLFCYGKLDLPAMQKAAAYLVGTHDFASFAAGGGATAQAVQSAYETPEKHGTVRTIYRSELTVSDPYMPCGACTPDNPYMPDTPCTPGGPCTPDSSCKPGAPSDAGKSVPDAYHGMLTYTISGNGFLYNMVRIIVGTLLEVGKGAIAPEEMPAILAACDRSAAGPTAPAHGLTLSKIYYPDL